MLHDMQRKISQFTIWAQECSESGARVWLQVDRKRTFQIGMECFDVSFLQRNYLEDESYLFRHRKEVSERIVDFGFCVEECCTSTWAKIDYIEDTVRWYDLRFSNSEAPDERTEFYFNRETYEKEAARIVKELDSICNKSKHIQSERDNG